MKRRYRFPDTERCREINATMRFNLGDASEDVKPYVTVAGVLVFVYLDPRDGVLRVSVDLDTAEPESVREDGTVPLAISVGGDHVFQG